MDSKEARKIKLLKAALIVAVIVILCMGLEIYESSKIAKNPIESDTNNIELNDSIILEGVFVPEEPSDVGYEFYKDGRVEYIGNVSIEYGNYHSIGEDEIQIEFYERVISEDTEIHEKVDRKENVKVIDDNTLIIDEEYDGEIHSNKWVRYQ